MYIFCQALRHAKLANPLKMATIIIFVNVKRVASISRLKRIQKINDKVNRTPLHYSYSYTWHRLVARDGDMKPTPVGKKGN